MRIGLDDENSRMLPRFIQHEQARAPRYGDLGCGRAARARGSVKTTVTGESAGGRYGEAARIRLKAASRRSALARGWAERA